MLVVNDRIKVPLREFRFTYSRSQGPGGQNVNKVNTKATLRWPVKHNLSLPVVVRNRFLDRYKRRITTEGDLVMTSQRFRDRGRNVADCLEKLRAMILEVATTPKKRVETKPSKGSKVRRRKNKEATSARKRLRKPPRMDD